MRPQRSGVMPTEERHDDPAGVQRSVPSVLAPVRTLHESNSSKSRRSARIDCAWAPASKMPEARHRTTINPAPKEAACQVSPAKNGLRKRIHAPSSALATPNQHLFPSCSPLDMTQSTSLAASALATRHPHVSRMPVTKPTHSSQKCACGRAATRAR